jgi:hypothetical protein
MREENKMAQKGLDTAFVHYGIRRCDLDILEDLAGKHDLDFSWLQEQILGKYHEQKIKNDELDSRTLESLISKALDKLEVSCKSRA